MDSRLDHINSQEKQKQAFEQQLRKQREREKIYDELYRIGIIFGIGTLFGLLISYWIH